MEFTVFVFTFHMLLFVAGFVHGVLQVYGIESTEALIVLVLVLMPGDRKG